MAARRAARSEVVDTSAMIRAIEAHPAIWNKTLQEYKSRAFTTAAWLSVCEQLNPDFRKYKAADRNAYSKVVLSKWRNVRDQWLKRCRAVAGETKSGQRPGRHYYYFDQLMFLLKCTDIQAKDLTADYTDEDRSISPEVFSYTPEMPQPQTVHKRVAEPETNRKRVKAEDEERDRRIVIAPMAPSEEDPMLLFFKGILPSTRDFSEEETLEFQSGVLAMVQNIKRGRVYLGGSMAEKWSLSAADSSQSGVSGPAADGLAAIVKQDFGGHFD